jgi:hypothetical protein
VNCSCQRIRVRDDDRARLTGSPISGFFRLSHSAKLSTRSVGNAYEIRLLTVRPGDETALRPAKPVPSCVKRHCPNHLAKQGGLKRVSPMLRPTAFARDKAVSDQPRDHDSKSIDDVAGCKRLEKDGGRAACGRPRDGSRVLLPVGRDYNHTRKHHDQTGRRLSPVPQPAQENLPTTECEACAAYR